MTGVEILSSKPIYEVEVYWWLIAVLASVGLLISLIVSIISWIYFGFDSTHIGFIILYTIVGAYIGFVGALIFKHETDTVDYIEHKVTISDEVSMNEFYEKYEVIDKEGKIYTVRERNEK